MYKVNLEVECIKRQMKNENGKKSINNWLPSRRKQVRKSTQTRKRYLIKRIIVSNFLSLIVIFATYLWVTFFLANIDSFWDIFRTKETNIKKPSITLVAPYLNAIPEATQSDKIDVTGKSKSGLKVSLFVDDAKFAETIVDSSGNFAFTDIPVGIFPEKIYAIASDKDGNTSSKSRIYEVVQDTTPPELKITNPPKNNESFKSTGHVYTVRGVTESDATVYINNQIAITNPTTGDFSESLRLKEGDNTIIIKAVDKALNETEKEVHVNFKKIE